MNLELALIPASPPSLHLSRQDVMMDPKIWSNIPPNLLELIFSRLPLQSLVQIRSLTKQWRSDFTTPIFQRVCSESRPMGFAVVESEKTDPIRVWVYDALARSWHALPLAYLPFSYLVAADGGLLCFVKYSRNTQCLQVAVMNPLTCACRELPPALGVQMFPKSFQMKVDSKTRHYTIKFLGSYDIKDPEVFHVYSSERNAWARQDWSRQPDIVGRYILINVYLGSIHTYDIKPGATSTILYPPDFDHDTVAQVEGSFLFQAEQGCLFLLKTQESKYTGDSDQKRWEHFSRIPKDAELHNYFFSVFLCGNSILLLGKKRKLFYDISHAFEDGDNNTDPTLMLMLDLFTNYGPTSPTTTSIPVACPGTVLSCDLMQSPEIAGFYCIAISKFRR